MRRLLVLCYFYPPLGGGGVHRVLGFTRHLPRHGWECTVVCADRGTTGWTDESLLARVPAGTEVIRVRGGSGLSAWLGLMRRRVGPALHARLRRAAAAQRLVADAGFVRRMVAARAARPRSAARAAGRIPRDALELAARQRAPRGARGARAHRSAVGRGLPRSVDRAPLPHAAEPRGIARATPPWSARCWRAPTLCSQHRAPTPTQSRPARPAPRRVIHLPNGFEPDEAAPPPAARARKSRADRERFELVFTGTLAQMPDAEVFLEALHDWFAHAPEARRRVRARFAGPYETGYEDRSIALGLKGIVEFMGPLRARRDARAPARGRDLLLLWKPRNYPTMVPGKLYEYLDSGRPVLAVLPPGDEAGALVARAGGEIVAPGDRAALAASLERRYHEWKAGGVRPAARPGWLPEHTRERLRGPARGRARRDRRRAAVSATARRPRSRASSA